MLITALNIMLLFALPFLFTGLINRVKSLWSGRIGPSLLQPARDFFRLLKKGEVISTSSSFVFRIAPSITFASVILAGLIVPMTCRQSVISFESDFLLFAYALSAGKFFAITGALDTGSSFEGMGASREAAFSCLVEPAFFIVIASLGVLGGEFSFEKLLTVSTVSGELKFLTVVLGVIALFIMLVAEGCRVPVDDPNTHLELTMIHEVMVLDNSGPDLGMIMYASAMKMVVIGSIIANVILPAGIPPALSLAGFLIIMTLLAVTIGTIESVMARLRMSHVPQFLFFMTAISVILLATIVLFNSGGLE